MTFIFYKLMQLFVVITFEAKSAARFDILYYYVIKVLKMFSIKFTVSKLEHF